MQDFDYQQYFKKRLSGFRSEGSDSKCLMHQTLSGLRVQGFRVLGFRVLGLRGFRVQGFRVQGFRV